MPTIKNTSPVNKASLICANHFPHYVSPRDCKMLENQDLGESLSNQSFGWNAWNSSEVWSAISFIFAWAASGGIMDSDTTFFFG